MDSNSIRLSAPLSMSNRSRVLRAERDLSQADLAAFLALSRQTVNSLETGKYDANPPRGFPDDEEGDRTEEQVKRGNAELPRFRSGSLGNPGPASQNIMTDPRHR